MPLRNNKTQYKMNTEDAAKTLQNILNSQSRPGQSIADSSVIDASLSLKGYKRRIIATACALALTIALPLFFSPIFTQGSHVSSDKADISIANFTVEDGKLFIDLTGPFIDMGSIYAVDSSGNTLKPSSFDIMREQVYFEYTGDEWNIFVNDINGNTVHMLLTPPM